MQKIMFLLLIILVTSCSFNSTKVIDDSDKSLNDKYNDNKTKEDKLTYQFSKRNIKVSDYENYNVSSTWEFQIIVKNPSNKSILLKSYEIIIDKYIGERKIINYTLPTNRTLPPGTKSMSRYDANTGKKIEYSAIPIITKNKTFTVEVNRYISPGEEVKLEPYNITTKDDPYMGLVWVNIEQG